MSYSEPWTWIHSRASPGPGASSQQVIYSAPITAAGNNNSSAAALRPSIKSHVGPDSVVMTTNTKTSRRRQQLDGEMVKTGMKQEVDLRASPLTPIIQCEHESDASADSNYRGANRGEKKRATFSCIRVETCRGERGGGAVILKPKPWLCFTAAVSAACRPSLCS